MTEFTELDIHISHSPADPGGKYIVVLTHYLLEGRSTKSSMTDLPLVNPPNPKTHAAEYGETLFSALFQDADVRAMFNAACNTADGLGRSLRVCLLVDPSASSLRDVHWEMLRDPDRDSWLFSSERRWLYRDLNYPDGPDRVAPRTGELRALVVISNPTDLADEQRPLHLGARRLAEVRVDEELERAKKALSGLKVDELVSKETQSVRVTTEALVQELRKGYDIVYLVCHGGYHPGAASLTEGHYLLLQKKSNGESELVNTQALVQAIHNMAAEQRPRLMVLASCQSGDTKSSADKGKLLGIGRSLVQNAGILSVVAMQGDISMDTVEVFMPVFFRALLESDGQIERAMAVARNHTQAAERKDWYVPALFSRPWDGRLWPKGDTMAGQVVRQALTKPRIYLSYAAPATTEEADLLDNVRQFLQQSGFEVKEAASQVESAEHWSHRVVQELGTCDGAVLLFNESALIDQNHRLWTEAGIMCWRRWMEGDFFRLIVLCLDEACKSHLQKGTGDLLSLADAPVLRHGSQNDTMKQLKIYLHALSQASYRHWRISDLKTRAARHFERMKIGTDRLTQAFADLRKLGKHNLPQTEEKSSRWWARALLCRGPDLLQDFVQNVRDLIDNHVEEEVRGLLPLVIPSWVDIRAAVLIPPIVTHRNVNEPSFYLQVVDRQSDPKWVASSYLRRACMHRSGQFDKSTVSESLPCWTVIFMRPKGNHSSKLDGIRTALRDVLLAEDTDEQELQAYWYGEEETQSEQVDEDDKIREKVSSKEGKGQPILLVLPGHWVAAESLLAQIREKFGSVAFFFLGTKPDEAAEAGIWLLKPSMTKQVYEQAYGAWQTLNEKFRPR